MKMEFPHLDSINYAASVQKLHNEFTSWFAEFRQGDMKVKLLAHPFGLAVEDSPDNCKMELIELQADMDTKRGYYENIPVDSYKLCLWKVCLFVPSCKKNDFPLWKHLLL